jgi:hypothetical protein
VILLAKVPLPDFVPNSVALLDESTIGAKFSNPFEDGLDDHGCHKLGVCLAICLGTLLYLSSEKRVANVIASLAPLGTNDMTGTG